MSFVLVTKSVEETIEDFTQELGLIKKALENNPEDAQLIAKRVIIQGKLEAIIQYKHFWDKRGDWDKIRHLQTINPSKYYEKCKMLVKSIKGITFCNKSKLFRVRLTIEGKVKNIGYFDTLPDAIDVMEMFLSK